MTNAEANQDQIKIYCTLMEDAKQRLGLVRQLVEGSISTTHIEYDVELMCLNLRKVLELIAFSSLAANKHEYGLRHSNFDTHWKANKILKLLEEINVNYYPIPVQFEHQNHFALIGTEHLTKDNFSFLYDKCSNVIHTWNPYKKEPREVDFKKSIKEWAEIIWNLLSIHYISIVGSENKLIVQMNHPDDGKVHVYTAEPIN